MAISAMWKKRVAGLAAPQEVEDDSTSGYDPMDDEDYYERNHARYDRDDDDDDYNRVFLSPLFSKKCDVCFAETTNKLDLDTGRRYCNRCLSYEGYEDLDYDYGVYHRQVSNPKRGTHWLKTREFHLKRQDDAQLKCWYDDVFDGWEGLGLQEYDAEMRLLRTATRHVQYERLGGARFCTKYNRPRAGRGYYKFTRRDHVGSYLQVDESNRDWSVVHADQSSAFYGKRDSYWLSVGLQPEWS